MIKHIINKVRQYEKIQLHRVNQHDNQLLLKERWDTMEENNETKDYFDSEFCNVKYIKNDNAVLLTWKKFACYEDYRKPTLFAAELLGKYSGSSFIVDAKNGFEDEKEDVKWGFEVLLPNMAKTGCKNVVFIMNEVNEIEGEMDMWTKEFMKYFTVKKVTSYDKAIESLKI